MRSPALSHLGSGRGHPSAEKRPPLRRHVLVTFDDGYKDGYDVALPILRSHGVRAAFFLTTSFIGTDQIAWWDQIAYMVRTSPRTTLRLSYPAPIVIDRRTLGDDRTIFRLLKICKQPRTDPSRLVTALEAACATRVPVAAPERLFLNWEEVAELARAGMAIGSHTHRHEMLVRLSERISAAAGRLAKSENKLSIKEAASFPFGSKSFSRQHSAASSKPVTRSPYHGGINTSDPLNLLKFRSIRCGLPIPSEDIPTQAMLGSALQDDLMVWKMMRNQRNHNVLDVQPYCSASSASSLVALYLFALAPSP